MAAETFEAVLGSPSEMLPLGVLNARDGWFQLNAPQVAPIVVAKLPVWLWSGTRRTGSPWRLR